MKVNLSIDEGLLKDLDVHCQKYHFERSEAIRQSIRGLIYQKPKEIVQNKSETPKVSVTPIVENTPDVYKGKSFQEGEEFGYPMILTWEWCKANATHPFLKGKLYKCRLVTYTDKDGYVGAIAGKIYEKAYICLDCIKKLEGMIEEGGFDYV